MMTVEEKSVEKSRRLADAAPKTPRPGAHGGPHAGGRRPPVQWRELTVTVPERLARYMETLRNWDWLRAHVVLGRHEIVRELVSMAKSAGRIIEQGPRTCAKGRFEFSEFAKLHRELGKSVRELHRRMHRIAADVRIELPRIPKEKEVKDGDESNRRVA